MYFVQLLLVSVFLSTLTQVEAKCCRAAHKLCADKTMPTPACCGYGKCDIACCKCEGVTTISYSSSLLTACPGTPWHCRTQSHPTAACPATKRAMPTLAFVVSRNVDSDQLETIQMFKDMTNGTGRLHKEQYVQYMAEYLRLGNFEGYAIKWHNHDVNGDGVVDLDEALSPG